MGRLLTWLASFWVLCGLQSVAPCLPLALCRDFATSWRDYPRTEQENPEDHISCYLGMEKNWHEGDGVESADALSLGRSFLVVRALLWVGYVLVDRISITASAVVVSVLNSVCRVLTRICMLLGESITVSAERICGQCRFSVRAEISVKRQSYVLPGDIITTVCDERFRCLELLFLPRFVCTTRPSRVSCSATLTFAKTETLASCCQVGPASRRHHYHCPRRTCLGSLL